MRISLLVANMAILFGVVMFVTSNQSSGETTRQNALAAVASSSASSPLDQLSSADIAAHVAHLVGLPEQASVDNHADTFNSQLTMATTVGETVVAKPLPVATTQKTRKDITTYVAQDGDTVTSVAQKFGITTDALRWSNSLTGDKLTAGKQLTVPPISGIVYTVKSGDTVDTLAQRYNANKDAIVTFNDAEIAGIAPGEVIIIPDGIQPVARTSVFSGTSFAWGGYTAVYSNNGYDFGWCTWWAAKRRMDIGRPIPSNLGNAWSWASLAQRAGFQVDDTPTVGAVAWYATIANPGHVGFVEQVNPDGSIWISDMNYFGVSQIGGTTPAGGWDHTSYHLVAPSGFGGFRFIH